MEGSGRLSRFLGCVSERRARAVCVVLFWKNAIIIHTWRETQRLQRQGSLRTAGAGVGVELEIRIESEVCEAGRVGSSGVGVQPLGREPVGRPHEHLLISDNTCRCGGPEHGEITLITLIR